MLESLNTNNLEYQKLTKDEMSRRGILGRLVGACADIINPTRNGRKYSEKLWENVFEDPIMKERIENGVCYGELGHPADREETDMEKIAVCLAEVPKKGTDGKLRAVFDILNTPNGRILKSLCDYGSTLGISSRGSGDLEVGYDGQESVNPDTYNCEGFDIVLIPAVKDARLEYVTESLDKKRYNKTLRQKLQESINNETEEHQKIMRESLDNLGIDLNEALGQDYSDIPEITSINYKNGKQNMLPGIANMQLFIQSLEDVNEPMFKIRTSRFPLSGADIKDEWLDIKKNGWSIQKTWDTSLSGFNEIYICKKLNESLNEDDKLTSHNTQSGTFVKDSNGNIVVETPTDDEATEFMKDQKINESVWDNLSTILTESKALSPDQWVQEYDNIKYEIEDWEHELAKIDKDNWSVDIKELSTEDSKRYEQALLNKEKAKDKLDKLVNNMPPEIKELISSQQKLDEAKLSPEEKMDLWHDGERRENIKACGDDKLWKYLKICQDKDYDEQVKIIEDELHNRGYSTYGTDRRKYIRTDDGENCLPGKELKVRLSDDKSKLYILNNEAGHSLASYLIDTIDWGEEGWENADSWDFDKSTDEFIVDRNSTHANEIAEEVFQRLSKKDESLDINEGQEAGDYDTALVDELQEALKLNRSLDEKIVNLQKQLSASNAQEMKLNEEIDSLKIKIVKLSDKAKTNKALTEKLSKLEKDLKESTEVVQTKKTALRETIDRDAKDRHALQESINSKDKEISQLKKQLTESKQRLSEEVANVKSLNEQLDTTHKDERQLKEKYTRKLEEKNALIEKYKNIAKTAVDNYINSRATVLGVSANEIKNRLPESYSFKDINEVCDDLREYNINMNSLPFSTSKLNESINVSAKNISNKTLIDNPDDEISDADMKLAEKFMR